MPSWPRNRREGVIGLAGGDGRLSTLAAPVRSPQFAFRNSLNTIWQQIYETFSAMTLALVVGALGGIASGATAAPITYDLTGAIPGDQALTGSHVYSASGGPNITAISGSYAQSGTGAPVAGDSFTAGGQLVGNNRGTDEMGVGICFGIGCNNGHIDDCDGPGSLDSFRGGIS